MMFLLLQLIDFKGLSRYKFLRSYENLLTASKETRPFAAHCKKDMLE